MDLPLLGKRKRGWGSAAWLQPFLVLLASLARYSVTKLTFPLGNALGRRNISHFFWYGGVAGEGLRSVGVGAPSPHPRATALSCPSLDIGGPGKSLVGQPRPAARC